MKYVVLIVILFTSKLSASDGECVVLDNLSFDKTTSNGLYGNIKTGTLKLKEDIALPIPKLKGAKFSVDDVNNSAISIINGTNVKLISVLEVTSSNAKPFLKQINELVQSHAVSQLNCHQYEKLIEVAGDINIQSGIKLSTVKYDQKIVLKLSGQSRFEAPLLINSYIYDIRGRLFIVEIFSELGL